MKMFREFTFICLSPACILCSNPQGSYKMIPLSEDPLFVALLYDCLAENICICVYMYKIYIYVCILLVHTNYK